MMTLFFIVTGAVAFSAIVFRFASGNAVRDMSALFRTENK